MRMKADVGPDRVSPLSNSRSYSSKRCATHSSQRRHDAAGRADGLAYAALSRDATRRGTMLSRVGDRTNQLKPPPGMTAAGLVDVADSGGVHVPTRGGLRPSAFRRLREYILAHLAENLSNPKLAALLCLSGYHLTHACRQSARR